MTASPGKLRVLTSFPRPRPTTNPYIVQLADVLDREPEVELLYFSWRTALTRRYDVVHLHWPETWLEGRTLPRRLVRLVLALVLCLKLWGTRVAVVRTWHNLDRPQGLWRVDYVVLALLDRLTRVRIHLNDETEARVRTITRVIPHGHYRDWYSGHPLSQRSPRRLAFVGRIRRYKGVEHLLDVFARLTDTSATLAIVGMPSSQELVDEVRALAAGDGRITLDLEYVDDAKLVRAITSSSVVVLPYRHMHNSGTVLAALSLDRPVLVPDNEVNRRLAREVGDAWVMRYEGELDEADLSRALAAAARICSKAGPDLSAREWTTAGRDHLAAYRLALRR